MLNVFKVGSSKTLQKLVDEFSQRTKPQSFVLSSSSCTQFLRKASANNDGSFDGNEL